MKRTLEAITPRTPDERLADDLKSIAIDTSGSNGGSISAMADLTQQRRLPYFFGQDKFTTRISSDTASYYSRISSDTARISSDRTILRLIFLRIGQFYDSYFFGYDSYFFLYDSYFLGYDLVFLRIQRLFLPYFFGYDVYFRRISSDTTILRLVFIPYILRGILRLVFLLIPAVILQYYLVYENPTARIFPRNVSTPSVFEFW